MRRPVNRDSEALIKEMFDKNKALVTANKRLEAKNKQVLPHMCALLWQQTNCYGH
jgi:hypothetical protein